jgi:hypothetical protein
MANWKRKKNYNGKNKDYSISNKLKKEKKVNDDFEVMLNNLSLEEVIALKLELSTKAISNRLYGFPIWSNLPSIVKEAAYKYALSATRTQNEAMRFLGLKLNSFYDLREIYDVDDFFLDTEDD